MKTEIRSPFIIQIWKDADECWQYRLFQDGYLIEPDAWDFSSKEAALEWARSHVRVISS